MSMKRMEQARFNMVEQQIQYARIEYIPWANLLLNHVKTCLFHTLHAHNN